MMVQNSYIDVSKEKQVYFKVKENDFWVVDTDTGTEEEDFMFFAETQMSHYDDKVRNETNSTQPYLKYYIV